MAPLEWIERSIGFVKRMRVCWMMALLEWIQLSIGFVKRMRIWRRIG